MATITESDEEKGQRIWYKDFGSAHSLRPTLECGVGVKGGLRVFPDPDPTKTIPTLTGAGCTTGLTRFGAAH